MIKAILFDMDGTITRPHIDWKALRARLGIPPESTIIGHLDSLPQPERERAHGILEATEMGAAEQAELNPGATDLLAELRSRSVRLALITNNHRRAMRRVVETFGLEFDLLLSREDAPMKPAPDLILLALKQLRIEPHQACFVGDGRYDRMASEAAGVPYIELVHDSQPPAPGTTIRALPELWDRLGSLDAERSNG